MQSTNLAKIIIHRLIPATLLALAILLFVGNYEQPWLIVGTNLAVISIYIFWNAVVIKRLDEERMRALQLKVQLTSLVSHELKSPLTIIKGAVDMMAEGVDGPVTPAQKHRLEVASRNVNRLTRLVSNVLDYQKFESGRVALSKAPCDINKMIQRTVADFSTVAAEKGVDVIDEAAPNLPRVNANDDAITQVLTNLINNAIKFSDHGKVVVNAQVKGSELIVSVQDSGIGIREDDIPKLFQGFSQVHDTPSKYHGTGLGLLISRKIIEMHGGKMWVESTFGRGSTFYFSLPLKAV